MLNKPKRLNEKIVKEGVKLYHKASCHPLIKEHVTPVVDSLLMTLPFIGFFWCCGIFYDPIALSCCCYLELPYLLCVEIPINSLVGFLLFLLSPFLVFIGSVVTGLWQFNLALAIAPVAFFILIGFSCTYCCGPF